jgi:hypothetical protein
MSTTANAGPAYWKSPAIVLATICGIAFLVLGLRSILIPAATSGGFGFPATEAISQAWVMVYGSRTMLLGAIALMLISLRQIVPIAIMFSIGAAMPLFDMALLARAGVLPGYGARHAVFIGVLGTVALLLWLKVIRERRGR